MEEGTEHGENTLPQPEEISQREKDDAMGSYLMMFASWAIGLPLPLINLIASVVYYFVNRKTSRFVAFHCHQALMSHIPVVLLNAGLVAWIIVLIAASLHFLGFFLVYLFFVVLVNVLYIVFSIIALTRAIKGRFYYMPLFGRLSYDYFYGPLAKARLKRHESWTNKPPEGA